MSQASTSLGIAMPHASLAMRNLRDAGAVQRDDGASIRGAVHRLTEDGARRLLMDLVGRLKKYTRQTRSYEGLAKMKFKWSDGTGNDFPKLKIKVKDELVAFGNPGEIKVDENGVIGGGIHLRPEEVNKLVEERGDEVVFFDGRNAFEAKVGKFKDAVVPDITTSHDFVKEIES